jgi:COMPASS component SWD3
MSSFNLANHTNISLECTNIFQVLDNQIDTLAIATDGQTLLCATINSQAYERRVCSHQEVSAWNIKTGKKLRIKSHSQYNIFSCDNMQQIVVAGDGRSIVSLDRHRTLMCWHIQSDVQLSLRKQREFDEMCQININVQGDFLLFPRKSYLGLDVYEIKTGKIIGSFPVKERDRIKSFVVSNDKKIITSYENDLDIKSWDLETGDKVMELKGHDHPIESLAISSDNKIMASGSDQRIKIWDVQLGTMLWSFYGHANLVRSLLITPDSRFLISAGDRKIKIWDLVTGNKINTIIAHNSSIRTLFLSNDGNTLVSGDADGTIKVWQINKISEIEAG